MTRAAMTTLLGFALGVSLSGVLIREGMRSAPPTPPLSPITQAHR